MALMRKDPPWIQVKGFEEPSREDYNANVHDKIRCPMLCFITPESN